MKRTLWTFCLCSLAVCLAGCWPEKVAWSPDGKRAIVVGGDGLYLCDASGKLSPLLVKAKEEGPFWPTWFPDSKRFAVVPKRPASTWEQLKDVLPDAEIKAIESKARDLAAQIKAGGDWAKRLSEAEGSGRLSDVELKEKEVDLCLRGGLDPAAADKLEAAKAYLKGEGSGTVMPLLVATAKDGTIVMGRPIACPRYPIWNVRVNSKGTFIAFTAGELTQEHPFADLWVVPADGTAPAVVVDHNVALFPDWAPDGQTLVYSRADHASQNDNDLCLGTLVRRHVTQNAGKVTIDEAQELAGLIFNGGTYVRCLRDGRIAFSAAGVTLPTTRADMPQRLNLFAVDPERNPSVTRLVPRDATEALPQQIATFEFSPDDRMAAVAGTNGEVVVVTLVSGAAKVVQPLWEHAPGTDAPTLQMVPTWRTPDQLCLMAQPAAWGEKSGRAEVVLWSASTGKFQVLSRDWPEIVMRAPK